MAKNRKIPICPRCGLHYLVHDIINDEIQCMLCNEWYKAYDYEEYTEAIENRMELH